MEQYNVEQKIQDFIADIEARNPNEPEFLQAVKEVAVTVIPFIAAHSQYDGKNFWKEWRSRKEQSSSVYHGLTIPEKFR